MKLSRDARRVLDRSVRSNPVSMQDLAEIESVVAMMPDDRKAVYRKVVSNPLGDLDRYSIHIRVQHLLTFTTFLLLAFTGLPIHYQDAFWAIPLNSMLGGIEVTRVIHRTLAAVMIFTMLYHIVTIGIGSVMRIMQGRFELGRTMVPLLKDLRDIKDDMLYFGGRRAQRPEMDKFMYKQKIHYLAAGFGNSVMVLSGSAFLFPDRWAAALPSGAAYYFQEFMRLAHPHEALLALFVIAFWHWYNVHLAPGRFPMQWTFLTGRITREHQIEEHFLEYLRCLVTMPEERRQIRELLQARRLAQPATLAAEDAEFFAELRAQVAAKGGRQAPTIPESV
jgi:formate dehydrogenase subunit gamma